MNGIITLCLVSLTGFGCAVETLKAPLLVDVCSGNEEAYCSRKGIAGQTDSLLLLGYHFTPVWEIDLDSDAPPISLGQFRVWMNDEELMSPTLQEETLWGYQVIQANIPDLLPPAVYDVFLQTPSGQTAFRPKAFTLIVP